MTIFSFKRNLHLQGLLAGCLLVFILAGCAPVAATRGNLVQDYQIERIQENRSSKSEVMRTLGSPTARDPFNDNVWYYIGQRTEKYGVLDPEVVEERIVRLTFNEGGKLAKISKITPERLQVPYAGDKTPTSGNEVTILQQFLGNIGRFNKPQQQQSPGI